MKISDGNWLLQKNLHVIYPLHFFEVIQAENMIYVHVAPIDTSKRENQLDTPLFTYEISTLQENTLRIKLSHFLGIYPRTPNFSLNKNPRIPLTCKEGDDFLHITSGKLTAVLHKTGRWAIDFFYDGQKITGSSEKSSGYATDIETNEHYMFEQLNLQVGELVYGLGERFTPFVKNGQTVDIWNQDGGTSTEQAYKNIPFYLTNKKYGVFIEQTEKVSLEVASEKVSQVQFSVKGESLTYHIIAADTPKEILTQYTAMTGKPPRLPAWSFGLWLSTSFTTNYDEKTVTHFIEGMAERNIPLHVFHFDCFWMKGFHWCDFTWDERVFPHPEEMLARLKKRGLKICVWINPYISQQSKLFAEGMKNHYFIETNTDDIWQWDKWQPGQAIVDFTNPAACKWYSYQLEALLDLGVDCFKTDFGERIPLDVHYADGSSPEKMHNYYTYLYNKTVFSILKKKRGENEAILFARSATVGSQKFPVHWGGDCHGTYESMAETLRGGLSLGLSGFSFWSHDIGGFENTAPADVYKRWCAFGLLSSHSRLHGSNSYRVPWAYDEEAVDVLRFFTNWKCRLMPYIYQLAEIAHEEGTPLLRAMFLEFPDDPAVEYLDRQYMLGDKLLVAPIMQADNKVKYYLPKGKWTHLFTGKIYIGGTWFEETYDFLSLPIFLRENSILPLGNNSNRPDYDYLSGLTVKVSPFQPNHAAQATVTSLDRNTKATIHIEHKDEQYILSLQGFTMPVKLMMPPGTYQVITGKAIVESFEDPSVYTLFENGEKIVLQQNNEPV